MAIMQTVISGIGPLPLSNVFNAEGDGDVNCYISGSNNFLNEIQKLPKPPQSQMTYKGVIKVSAGFYRKLSNRKIEIGEKDELLVMELKKRD